MKFLFVLGARSEWGYIKPIIDLATKNGHVSEIWACNMSVLARFGSLIDEIQSDGYQVSGKFFTAVDGDNRISMGKSLGMTILTASDWFANNSVDWVVVAGDRVEQLGVTLAAAFQYKPIAHIQAGERSGNIDGVTRHAIARYAHIHFAANEDSVERLVRSGEEKKRIHLTGAPQLDEIQLTKVPDIQELIARKIVDDEKFALAVLHGTTEEDGEFRLNAENLVSTLANLEQSVIWIGSNNDSDKQTIEKTIKNSLRTKDKFYTNLNRIDYLGLLKNCQYLIGNSSSGILEAPSFHTPAINLGRRQDLRFRGRNVIDSSFEPEDIISSITLAKSSTFKESLVNSSNPYGDGKSSERILETLENISVTPEFLIKQIAY